MVWYDQSPRWSSTTLLEEQGGRSQRHSKVALEEQARLLRVSTFRPQTGVELALHCMTLHCITLHYIALHCITLHYIALHCIALHCIALHCISLHCIALHCIALHCIASWAMRLPAPHRTRNGGRGRARHGTARHGAAVCCARTQRKIKSEQSGASAGWNGRPPPVGPPAAGCGCWSGCCRSGCLLLLL